MKRARVYKRENNGNKQCLILLIQPFLTKKIPKSLPFCYGTGGLPYILKSNLQSDE
jgi:hypothetical protein